jgi:hypothetical protein
MGIRELIAPPASDLGSYQAPMNYELAGKTIDIKFEDGGTASFEFAEYPVREVGVDGSAQKLPYCCAKVADTVFLLQYLVRDVYVALALDTETQTATRVIADSKLQITRSVGAIGSGGSAEKHTTAPGLKGTITWTFGKKPSSVFKVVYGGEGVAITSDGTAGELAATDFAAVRVTDTVYLQTAIVTAGGHKNVAVLLSNFNNLTSVGGIFRVAPGEGAVHTPIGGYGRFTA